MIKKALGKGLSALIPDSYAEKIKKDDALIEKEIQKVKQESPAGFQLIPMEKIVPNPDQPRQHFSEKGIEELAASIKEKGILQPIIITQTKDRQNYMVLCGERRFRAAKVCGLQQIPAIIKEVAESEFLEWALIENIQREDLNPLEEAEAYRRLLEEQMLSQEELAKRVGKDRSTIANIVRLLRLPVEIHAYIVAGNLSNGHARALLGLLTPEHQRQMAKRIVEENLSVRQVEAIVTRSNAHKRKPKQARHLHPEIVDLENRLTQHLGTRVKIFPRKNQKEGRLEIHYFSLDDLDRVLSVIGLPKQ